MAEEHNQTAPEDINYTTNTNEETIHTEESVVTNTTTTTVSEPSAEIVEEFVKPKKNILFKVLVGIIAFLLLLLIAGIILYFTGFFEPKELKTEEQHTEQPVAEQHQADPHGEQHSTNEVAKPEAPAENNYKFDLKNINSKKLNEQIANMTNKNSTEEKKATVEKKKEKELLSNQENELLKEKTLLEEKKLELEKEKAQLEIMKRDHEVLKEDRKVDSSKEHASTTAIIDDKKEEASSSLEKNSPAAAKENTANNQFLLFINVAKINGELYKKYLDKITAINPNVRLCRDEKNKIEIYFGPFEKSEDRTELLNKLIKNKFTEAYAVEFTQEEFDKRCNY